MKTFTAIILLILTLLYAGFSSENVQTSSGVSREYVPDVMGKVNAAGQDSRAYTYTVSELDSFPNFPGFPKHISGSSYEGGIVCNMDTDSDLEMVYCIGYTVQAWNPDGSSVPGWPKTMSYPASGSAAFGDIDGDGQGEIVVGTYFGSSNGSIYAFEKNGSNVTGFPVSHGYTTRSIVLADIDNNGSMEIITNKRLSGSGEVWVYSGNGTVYPGWPKTINHVPASSSAVGDITGDGYPEIIAESYISLYAWDRNGILLPGFPFNQPSNDVNSYSSPVLADLTGDNIREIIWGTHILGDGGNVYVIKNDGTILPGWPKGVGYWIYGPPAVGFINNDNVLDIAVGDQVLSPTPTDFVYAWDKNGNFLPGFPIGPLNAINNQISLGDIDNDNMTELVFDDNSQSGGIGKYLAYNHDGTPAAGWPVLTTGTTFFNTLCLADVNFNGVLDILGGAIEGSGSNTFVNVYLWNTGINYNSARVFNPMWQYNTRHNGVYGDNSLVGLEPVSGIIPDDYELSQNYPNPFNAITNFELRISNFGLVTLKVFDARGREVSTLVNENLKTGVYHIRFDGSGYSSGIYFCRMTVRQAGSSTGGFTETKKMVMIK